MKNRREYQSALAAEYALGTLRGLARIKFERQILRNPELAEEVSRWQNLFSQMDNSLQPVTPPAWIWKKLQLQLPPPKKSEASSIRRASGTYLGWAIAACLAALLLVPRLLVQPEAPIPVAVLASSEQNGQWIVSMDKSTRSLTLTPLSAAPIGEQHSLELWSIAAGEKPHSLGLLNASGPTQIAFNEVPLAKGNVLAISVEPHGGSPTGQPTGAVLYSGPLQNI